MKEQILSMLAPGHPWGELLQFYPTLDSTNTLAKALGAQGAPHGTVIIAGAQAGLRYYRADAPDLRRSRGCNRRH